MKLIIAILLSILCHSAMAERIDIADMATFDINNWEVKEFDGKTEYTMVMQDQQRVLQAISRNSASGLFLKKKIDLRKTPFLNWQWRIDTPLEGLNEQSKEGDDYAARIYIVVSGGILFWQTRALNYVWSSNQQQGSRWNNAYTDHAKMIAVDGINSTKGEWQDHKRNIAVDMREMFGEEILEIDAIAIMTDTDNSGLEAKAYYGDIFFSSQ